jgi:hypothetical protein
MGERTLDDYLDDMILNRRTPQQIWAVAKATRWASQADEALQMAEKRLCKKVTKN